MTEVIRLYYLPSPNGRKISIALEEMALPYEVKMVDIFKLEAQTPEYLRICPNGRIPAIVDHDSQGEEIRVFESGAILQYLGRKSGLFYPCASEVLRAWVDSWIFWQMAGLGPMSGQITWFKRAAEKRGRDPNETSLALYRFTKETKRLYGVLEHALKNRDFICDSYSIADMACWPWVEHYASHVGGLEAYPAIGAWHQRIASRDAVQRAMAIKADHVIPTARATGGAV